MRNELVKDARIYNGGDIANEEKFGTITAQLIDKWGTFVYIRYDDGSETKRLPISNFSSEYKGHGGTCFVTVKAYNAFRHARLTEAGFAGYVDAK